MGHLIKLTDTSQDVLEVTCLDESRYNEWNAFVKTNTSTFVFSDSNFASIYCNQLNINFKIIAINDCDEIIGGALVYVKKNENNEEEIFVPPFIYYTTILWNDKYTKHPAELNTHPVYKLINYIQCNFKKAEFWLDTSYTDVRPFIWARWTVTPRFTYKTEPKSILNSISVYKSKKRNRYRNALLKYTFKKVNEIEPVFVSLLENSFANHNTTMPISNIDLLVMLNALLEKNIIDVFKVSSIGENDTQAFAIILKNNSEALHWLISSSPGESMRALVLYLLDYYKEECTHYDLCGANTPSIAYFKRNFSKTLISHYIIKFN